MSTASIKGRAARWNSMYPCRCGEPLYVYPAIITDRQVMYNYECDKCSNQGRWPPFNPWSKKYNG